MYVPQNCSSETLQQQFPALMEGIICIDITAIKDMDISGQDFITYYKNKYPVNAIESWIVFYKEAISIIEEAILEGNTTRERIEQFLRDYDENNSRH
jgi:hypothetical protein